MGSPKWPVLHVVRLSQRRTSDQGQSVSESQTAKKGRVEFPVRVKRLLAERSGYRCSFPGCGKLTVGPGHTSDESASIGVAAHIFSAATRGPRGPGFGSDHSRRTVENGIWLCADHSRLIDANRGDRYPPGVLKRFRYRHEARIDMELGHRPLGWIEELRIHRSSVFAPNSRLRLSKLTLIVGDNGTGKTFLFRLLYSLSAPARSDPGRVFLHGENLRFSIRLWNPEPHEIVWHQTKDDFEIEMDGNEVPYCPLPIDVFFQEKVRRNQSLEQFLCRKRQENGGSTAGLDDVLLLSEYLELSEDVVLKLLPKVGSFVEHLVSNARVEVHSGARRILVEDRKWRPDAPIHKISGGMLEMMVFDCVVYHARLVSEHTPTLLLLNLPLLHLDEKRMGQYARLLVSEEFKFQTIVTSPDPRWLGGDIPWETVRLRKAKSAVCIEEVT